MADITSPVSKPVQKQDSPPDEESIASAKEARLRYVTDRGPCIQRKRNGKGFRYVDADGKAVNAETVKRIQKLAIPPAWENVWICPQADGHIQATGRDARGRKQYKYHAQWTTVRNATKFDDMIDFARALPAIRRRAARDMKLPGLPKEKVLAAVVRVMEHTNIRIGNTEYAEENQSFGLSTMRDRHVRVRGGNVQFKFRGKSGKFHEIDFDNEHLAGIVKRCQDLPGYQLFQFLDDQGEARDVTSDDVNAYLGETGGGEFTAKDFRTWAGTIRAAEVLSALGSSKPTEKALIMAIDEVRAELGNTRAVCRKFYIHPAVTAAYLDGTLATWFADPPRGSSRNGLTSGEKAVLRLLKKSRASRCG